jgi:[ribosomal protein S18]-alanine N-acetyltransferase
MPAWATGTRAFKRESTLAQAMRSSGVVTTGDASGGNEPVEFCFGPMSQADAEAIAAWRYPGEYSFYDRTDPDDLAELLDPLARADQYFAIDTKVGSLIGFFQYKRPHGSSLDIGLGLHPSWTGQGLGESFLQAGLDYARRRFAPEQFTLSVVSFNRRAITVYERAGFDKVRVFNHRTNGRDWEFIEMRRPA